eukprot:10709252-Lingulodinium_polyedra.AAC.1
MSLSFAHGAMITRIAHPRFTINDGRAARSKPWTTRGASSMPHQLGTPRLWFTALSGSLNFSQGENVACNALTVACK